MLVYLMPDFLSLTTHVDDRLNPTQRKIGDLLAESNIVAVYRNETLLCA